MPLLIDNLSDINREFQAPKSMTTEELGENLTRLVWESFSDFIADVDVEAPVSELTEGPRMDGEATEDAATAEESLIFLMWAHTRGTQLAFIGRTEEELVRKGLDHMHQAVFEDMVEHGTPRSRLPYFELRAGARYAEYSAAAEVSDARLGRAVVRHLRGFDDTPEVVKGVAERAIAVANPLRDFLEDVELIA